MRRSKFRALALLLSVCLLLGCAACGGGALATAMRLARTQGTVEIVNNFGKSVTPREDLALYSGYQLTTSGSSYAWIDLDDVKLTKMDENSEIEIQKDGKKLRVEVLSGSLFFNVTQPLEDDEELNICTSTMMVGIRGTCGWVRTPGPDHMEVWLLEGTVECTVSGVSVTVSAGEMAAMTSDGTIAVRSFDEDEIPAFVREEIDENLLPGHTAGGSSPAPTPPGGGDDPPTPSAPSGGGFSLADRLEELRRNSVSYDRILINRFDGTLERYDPPEALGFINGVMADVNGDGEEELVTVSALSSRRMELEIFDSEGLQYCAADIGLGYDTAEFGGGGSQIDVFLYHNAVQDVWCVGVCGTIQGSALQVLDASLFYITRGVVGSVGSWYWDDVSYDQQRLDRVQRDLEAESWPYMEADFLSFRDASTIDSCVLLARMAVEKVSEPGGNLTERYLRIFAPEELAGLP